MAKQTWSLPILFTGQSFPGALRRGKEGKGAGQSKVKDGREAQRQPGPGSHVGKEGMSGAFMWYSHNLGNGLSGLAFLVALFKGAGIPVQPALSHAV